MKRSIVYIANRLYLIVGIYVATIVIAAFAFSYLESKSVGDGLWWAFITAMTIGYGDIFPVTTSGRVLAVIFSHIWIFGIIPMVVANIIIRLIDDKNEFSDAEQKELFLKLENIEKRLDNNKEN